MSEPEPWYDLCPASALPGEGGHYITFRGRPLAVLRSTAGQIHVLDDTCPHAGGSLSAGYIDQGCIICPWHGWPFRITDGRCPDNEQIGVRTYPARVHAGQVQIQWPTDAQP